MKLLRPMRILVFFDLPVTKKTERKLASSFRKFLLRDGYHMVQFSVYARFCNGLDSVEKHKRRLESFAPKKGSVRIMTITDKQYGKMEVLRGEQFSNDEKIAGQQLCIF